MPKIQAATVADHRAAQRRALVDAARELLTEEGSASVTFAAVARRTGLARNSVYKYFASRDELLAAVVSEVIPRWMTAIGEAIALAPTPRERVAAYVRVQLELVRAGEHRVAQAMTGTRDTAILRTWGAHAHRELLGPITDALVALGDPDPRRTAMLVQGVVHAATAAIEGGDDFEAVTNRALALVLNGIAPSDRPASPEPTPAR